MSYVLAGKNTNDQQKKSKQDKEYNDVNADINEVEFSQILTVQNIKSTSPGNS